MPKSALFIFSLAMVIGCGTDNREPVLAVVEGTVTYKGKPLKGGQIVFHHVMGRPYAADLAADGTFKTRAALGQTKVSIEYREPGKEEKGGKPGMLAPGKSLIPEKYGDPHASKLTFEVKAGTNKADFNLD